MNYFEHQSEINLPSAPLEIPQKSMFKSDEICSLIGIKPYVLRFWESEFDIISPLTSSTGQKLYDHKDIEVLVQIKKFLFEDKMMIDKAKMEVSKIFAAPQMGQPHPEKEEVVVEFSRENLSFKDREKLNKAKEMLLSISAKLKAKNPALDQLLH